MRFVYAILCLFLIALAVFAESPRYTVESKIPKYTVVNKVPAVIVQPVPEVRQSFPIMPDILARDAPDKRLLSPGLIQTGRIIIGAGRVGRYGGTGNCASG